MVDGAFSTYGIQAKYIQNIGKLVCRNEIVGRARCRWQHNIKILFKFGGRMWNGLTWLKTGIRE